MDKLVELIERMKTERPATWEELPDIELYRDQVLGYMKRQHPLQVEDDQLTGAMINNYIKSGLLPRASGKKYTKDHLVYLTAICSLKQVLSVNETDMLLKQQSEMQEAKQFYNVYRKMMDDAYLDTASRLKGIQKKDDLAQAALQLALSSYCQKLACERILDMLEEKEADTKEK